MRFFVSLIFNLLCCFINSRSGKLNNHLEAAIHEAMSGGQNVWDCKLIYFSIILCFFENKLYYTFW